MNDGLISLTLIEDKYKESKPVVYGTLKAIQYLAGIGICGLITSQMVTIVATQMRTGEATTVLKYPLWIMNTGILLGLALIVLLGLVKLAGLKEYFVTKK